MSEAMEPTRVWKCGACGCPRGADAATLATWDKDARNCGMHDCRCDEHAPGHGPSQPQVAAGQRRRGTFGLVFIVEKHGEFYRRRFEDSGNLGTRDCTAEELAEKSELLTDAPAVTPPPTPPPRYNIAAGAELRYSNGHPRTALEAIQARKPPEPWRPSVDEWDLLPDAHGVVRS